MQTGQENKPTDWFHNTSVPVCECVCGGNHIPTVGGGADLDSSGPALWSGLQIGFHLLRGWKTHAEPMQPSHLLTPPPPAHPCTETSASLAAALLTNIWIALWKCLDSDCTYPPAALMASAVMRHRVARGGSAGSGPACVQYILCNTERFRRKRSGFPSVKRAWRLLLLDEGRQRIQFSRERKESDSCGCSRLRSSSFHRVWTVGRL